MPLRRLLSVPGFWLAWALLAVMVPLALPLLAVLDLLRGTRFVAVRCALTLLVVASCELVGMLAAAGLWLWGMLRRPGTDAWLAAHFRLEAWWADTLLRAAMAIFGLRLELEGAAEAQPGRGPYVLLLRHASTVDTLLASALIARPHGMQIRYVLKRELLWDPCLDIVGNRLPNVFVDRSSKESAREVARVRGLAEGLGPRDVVLIYPEGTRFSEARRARIRERLEAEGPEDLRALAGELRQLLPPRPGGTLALVEAAEGADVLLLSHTGFEGATTLASLWSGALVGRQIRVGLRRVPRAELPEGREALREWLLAEWRRMDAWVSARAASPSA